MNRRQFLGATAVGLVAAGSQTLSAATQQNSNSRGLKIRFLGTGAADWNGRDNRGELRRLTSILVEDKILIDFTPSNEDMLPQGIHPKTIFYTHSHGDHYNPAVALQLGVEKVYLSETWYDIALSDFTKKAKELNLPLPKIYPLCTGLPVVIDDLAFTPVPGNHATSNIRELALLYLIEKGETRLLYATDTGGIPAVAARMVGIDAHSKGTPITALIMESTMGIEHDFDFRLFTHSSVALVKKTIDVLTETKRYQPKSNQPAYITHLARTLHGTQAELDKQLPAPIRAAYDGLEITF